ncbi:hypothetical protein ACET3Z_004140 [Daucus carota]
MKGISKFISILVFLTFFLSSSTSYPEPCDPDTADPIIKQKLTGKKIQNELQWEVSIESGCFCAQTDVELACHGFTTVEPLDPNIITRDSEDVCSLVHPVRPGDKYVFYYARSRSYNFTTISFGVACS